jgi:YVTN family beta-propeller protein
LIPRTNGMRMFSWKKAGCAAGLLCAFLICSSCGDTYRPIANPIVSPGGDPQPINYAFVLFTNPNGPGGVTGQGTIEEIDVSGDSVTLDAPVGRNPVYAYMVSQAANSSVANLVVVNEDDHSLSNMTFIGASTTSNTTVTLPLTSVPIAFMGHATTTYVLNSSEAGVCPNGALDVLTNNSVVTNTVCVGVNPVSFVQLPSGGKVYVLNQGDNTVSVVDPVSQTVLATIPVGTTPVWASVNLDGSYVFVVNQGSNNVTAIKTADNTTTNFAVGTTPNFSFYDSRRNRVYVTNGGSNDVSVIDISQGTPTILVQHVALGAGAVNPTGLVPLPDGSRYYVANTTSNNVSVIDAGSNTPVVNPISLGPAASTAQPLYIETEPTSTKVYVTTPAPPAGTTTTTNPNGAPGTTVIRTNTNTISNFLQAPQSDPSCQVNPTAGTTCTYQTPLKVLTFVR